MIRFSINQREKKWGNMIPIRDVQGKRDFAGQPLGDGFDCVKSNSLKKDKSLIKDYFLY